MVIPSRGIHLIRVVFVVCALLVQWFVGVGVDDGHTPSRVHMEELTLKSCCDVVVGSFFRRLFLLRSSSVADVAKMCVCVCFFFTNLFFVPTVWQITMMICKQASKAKQSKTKKTRCLFYDCIHTHVPYANV